MSILRTRLPLFRRHEGGVAAVEFALIAPLLVLLFFGTIELSNLLITDSKLRNVAASISDLLTQKSNGAVSAGDLNIANLAAAQIMIPLPVFGPRLAILMTTYRPTSTTAGNVLWSRLIVGGVVGNQQGTVMGLTTPNCANTGIPTALLPKTDTSPFNDVLQVTAVYDWTPWFATIFNTTIRLRSTNYNMPRYSLVLNPGPSITPPC